MKERNRLCEYSYIWTSALSNYCILLKCLQKTTKNNHQTFPRSLWKWVLQHMQTESVVQNSNAIYSNSIHYLISALTYLVYRHQLFAFFAPFVYIYTITWHNFHRYCICHIHSVYIQKHRLPSNRFRFVFENLHPSESIQFRTIQPENVSNKNSNWGKDITAKMNKPKMKRRRDRNNNKTNKMKRILNRNQKSNSGKWEKGEKGERYELISI